jgi:Adenine-specific methyltransferase EcoRI
MSKNLSLNKAKELGNDEFYTLYEDIALELSHYKEAFIGKRVYCNCDDPSLSNFWKYLNENMGELGIASLVSTYLVKGGQSYMRESSNGITKDTPLYGDGDFRSEECIEILRDCDMVITNPPFSLFREFIGLLESMGKEYLIIGSKNAISYKEVIPLLVSGKCNIGVTNPKRFTQPDGTIKQFGNIGWFTSLVRDNPIEPIILTKLYNEIDYPKYNEYDAINIDKVANIPMDYEGWMGVPITFLDHWCKEQFEVKGLIEGKYRRIGDREVYQRLEIKHKSTLG